MNFSENDDQPSEYSRVSRRLSGMPKYAQAFNIAMNELAETIAKKINASGIEMVGPLRGELAKLLKETDYETFENKDGDKFIFRLVPQDFVPGLYPKYEPCADLTPHVGNVILFKDQESNELFVPHQLMPIPFDITVGKIIAMKGPIGKRLFGALPAKPDANGKNAGAAKGAEGKAEKVAALLSEEEKTNQAREEAAHQREVEAERLSRKLAKQRQRRMNMAKEAGHELVARPRPESLNRALQRVTAKKQPLTPQQRQAAQEMSVHLAQFKAGLRKLSQVVGRAARDTKKGIKTAAAAEKAIEELTAKLGMKSASERSDVIVAKVEAKKETLVQAKERVEKAAKCLAEAQKALEEYKKTHAWQDEPVTAKQQEGTSMQILPRPAQPKAEITANLQPR